jgi:exonuclease SbcC
MEIRLSKLSLLNFKGIKEFTTDFTDLTTISADNGVGKTTIHDAFTYLLFGKDSMDNSVFEIKTLDKNNKAIHHLDHQVTGEIKCDGVKTVFRRVYKEKWQNKRGEETREFTGHTTDYFVDDVPLNQREYQGKVSSMVDEQVFKTITSSSFFNNMQWAQRRELLTKVVGTVTDREIVDANPKFKTILDAITNKSLEGYKKQLAAERKLLKESLEEIPSRISEVNRSVPEKQDYAKTEQELAALKRERDKIEQQLDDSSKRFSDANNENQKIQTRVYELEGSLAEIRQQVKLKNDATERNAGSEMEELKGEAVSVQRSIERIQADIKDLEGKKEGLETKVQTLRDMWSKRNAESLTFKEGEFTCPTCKRELEPDTIQLRKDEMTASFNNRKKEDLDRINSEGAGYVRQAKEIAGEIDTQNEMIDEKNKKIKEIQAGITDAEKSTGGNVTLQKAEDLPEYKEIQKQIEQSRADIKEIDPEDKPDLKQKRVDISDQIDDLKEILSQKAVEERAQVRIAELKKQEKEYSQQLADLEKTEFLVKGFETDKVNAIEAQVNEMFNLVQFKMFNQLVNGGYEPTCEAMINGVPFSSLSNSERINAGIDIINTLSDHFDVTAPIWIDNAESITNIIPTKSQLIRLVVVQGLDKLEVELAQRELVES